MVTGRKTFDAGHLFVDEWMADLKLSDEILGQRMGKSRTTIWRWRTEQNRLNPKKIAALASAMGCRPEDFWRHPSRPSLDAILNREPDEVVRRAAELIRVMLKPAA